MEAYWRILPAQKVLALVLLLAAAWGCGSDRVKNIKVLHELNRMAVSNLDSKSEKELAAVIDSLQTVRPADTVMARLSAEIVNSLYKASRKHELLEYVRQAKPRLQAIARHTRQVQTQLALMDINVAECYFDLGMIDNAMQVLISLSVEAEERGLDGVMAVIYNDMGFAYLYRGNSDKALEMLRRGLKHADRSLDGGIAAEIYSNMAWAYMQKRLYDKSIEYSMTAINHVVPGDTLELMKVRCNVALHYLTMGEYSLARKMLEQCMDYYQQNDVRDQLGFVYLNLALATFKEGNHEAAEEILDKGMPYREYASLINQKAYINNYAAVCDSLGKQAKANYLLKLKGTICDSIITGGNGRMLTRLYEEELQRGQSLRQTFERGRRVLWLWIVGLGCLLLAAVAAIFWGRRLAGRQHHADLAEMTTLKQALHEASLNEQRLSAACAAAHHETQGLQKDPSVAGSKESLNKVRKIASTLAQTNGQKHLLTNLLNRDFFGRLLEICPQLTSSDLRLCALLSHGMTSKEIADLTSREVASVDIARIRIRRKLGLKSDEDLCKYLITVAGAGSRS